MFNDYIIRLQLLRDTYRKVRDSGDMFNKYTDGQLSSLATEITRISTIINREIEKGSKND